MRLDAYEDRDEAGQVLAESLAAYAGRDDVVVLGLPRGGVPVAARVARALAAPLDVLVVRKLGLPGHAELAMGALALVGGDVAVVRNERVLRRHRVTAAQFESARSRELEPLRERENDLRRGREAVRVRDRTVVVVDDGLATGATMRAALAALRTQHPSRVVVAVPVGSRSTCGMLEGEADEVVCAWFPAAFSAVGQAYVDFGQTTDEEVRRALDDAG